MLGGGRPRADRPPTLPELGDGRLRAPRRGHAGRAADRRSESRRACPRDGPLEAGEAMTIATGGVVPDGADAVVPIEHVTVAGDVGAGRRRRPVGRECPPARRRRRSGCASPRGRHASLRVPDRSARVGGVAEPRCGRRPSVAIVTTGTELRPPGETARGRADLRVERRHARRPARGRRRDRRAHRRRRGRRGRTSRRARAGARRRRRRHLGRGLGRPARPRAADRSRSSARRRCSGASRCGPGSRSRSPSAARRSSSGSRATPSRRSSARSSSSSPRFGRSRA